MRRALELAEQASGLTSPNPLVGAVVVRDGVVVGEGFHRGAGEAHAEIDALSAAGERAQGATLYVTLEPCAHWGRTPPCAPQVARSGVRRVVAALADPNPRVAGRGLSILREAGVEVMVGLLADEAQGQNRCFLTAMRFGRPHVTLKIAMTLDGKIADREGASRWITGAAARAEAHRLRSQSDAVLVGIGTVLADDPELTVRLERPWPREPYRVVLDADARTPVDARVVRVATPARTLVMIGHDAPTDRAARLVGAGAAVVRGPGRQGHLDLEIVLAELHKRDVRALLVEGGAEVHGAFLEAGYVDRVVVFIAPLLLGGRGALSAIGGHGLPLKSSQRLGPLTVRAVGPDLLVEADVVGPHV
ncbi:MAG: bifunctional diaminohydroxyphosphoribosylaminopyrimidine deaminase/5-amino-6-(5-phosphoribosylamino)uracil reductase RibD [Candidatus Rokuibacteriota bacterium]